MVMIELPLAKAFMLIEPGPVTLVTTAMGRRKNIMTISWTVVMDFTPKLAFVTGPWNHSYQALVENGECVIAIPSADMSDTVVGIGTCSGADTDKFKKFGLTPVKAKTVKAPLIAECIGNIECRVIDHVKRHDLFVLEGVRAWIDPHASKRRMFHAVGDGTFVADGRRFSHRALMAGKLPPGV
jgi:flavin reductase (DIM6/NTAB) family NADH-FMN oxidoreductase RutF